MTAAKAAKPADPLAKLRLPFEAHQISKLPKPLKKDAPKGRCNECGGWHGLPAVHLDYVGHAALTDRLLDTDLHWTWTPMATTPEGLPKLDGNGGLWINLTVCSVTRPGYGDADGKTGGNATKEQIGDALRNAAMRFGAALDLWHKGDLHRDQGVEGQEDEPRQERQQQRREPDRADFTASLDGAKAAIDLLSTDDGLRKWVDEQAAFLKELPEGPHNELVAYWKARMAKVREPATSDFAAMDYTDQLKTAVGHIAICKTRVDLDKWAAHYQDWTAKIPDDDYNMLNKAWKERHAALAPQQREGFN